jgi:hypothetical protein
MTDNKSARNRNSPLNGQPVPSGRPKGCPNKLGHEAKENIDEVYRKLGDIKAHVLFLQKHPKELAKFYSDVYPKLLAISVQHSGPEGGPMVMIMSRPGK